MMLEEYFAGRDESMQIFAALRCALDAIGPTELRVTKSQVAFQRRRTVAIAWIPALYLRGITAPLVLTFSFGTRNPSPRWKEIVAAAPGRFTHHLEIYSPAEVDAEVCAWLQEAWADAS